MTTDNRSWDVHPMVGGAPAPTVREMIEDTVIAFESYSAKYIENLESMSADEIVEMLKKGEELTVKMSDINGYCGLRYSADTTDKDAGQLYSWSNEARSRIRAAMTLLEMKLGDFAKDNPHLSLADALDNYKHYLERLIAEAPYRLSPEEETMIAAKDVYGIQLFSQLQEAWVSQKTFEIELGGERVTVPLPKLSSLRMDPDREVRAMASRMLYTSYSDDKLLHGTALRGICADHVSMTKRRGMPSTMTQSLLDQDVDRKAIEALLKTIESTAKEFQEFLKLKAKYFGTKKLLGHDVIAPWTTDPVWSFEWQEGREIVIDSFMSFDQELGTVVKSMFDEQRIDSANRVGKANIAFCAGWPSAKKTFILINYNNTIDSTYTLAHENGHSAQSDLIYKNQTPHNYRGSSCMAETGSIFGELLLTDRILGMSETDEQRLEILSHVLNSFFYTVYYVGTRALFETTLYNAIEDGKLLDADLACELWNAAKKRTFGDAVDWTEGMEYEWARIPHFFIPNFRYYNYSYSFAQMLVFAVYEEYQKSSADFNGRFKTLLAAGGSKSPREQIADFGYDLTDSGFWNLGPKQADRFLSELKKLV
ncbi:MAG: M3 family metallopeptidase [Candidatus Thorarchaeota archaeon]